MNDVTHMIDAVLWFQMGMSFIILFGAALGFLMDAFLKLNSYPRLMYQNYQEYFTLETLQFISPRARKLYAKTSVKSVVIFYFAFGIFSWAISVGAFSVLVSDWSEEVVFNQIWLSLTLYLVSIVVYALFCWVLYFVFVHRKSQFETSNEVLLANFRKFKNDWIAAHGNERIEIKVPGLINPLPSRLPRFMLPRARYVIPTRVLKYYYKHSPKYYEYYFLEALRNHLFLTRMLVNQIIVTGERVFLRNYSKELNIVEIKFAIIHNMLSEMDKIEKHLI